MCQLIGYFHKQDINKDIEILKYTEITRIEKLRLLFAYILRLGNLAWFYPRFPHVNIISFH